MPELPEVETMRRGILPLVGAAIVDAHCVKNHCKPIRVTPSEPVLRRRLIGRTIVDVERAGKRVVVCLENDQVLVFEPRMTGLVLLSNPPSEEHLRFRLTLKGPQRYLWYWDRRGLGAILLMSRDELQRNILDGKLGPDALKITFAEFVERVGSSTQPIKVVLLDQKRLAGIGNLYASEILHVARIHPARPANRVSRAEWQRLYEAMEYVLHEAILHEGSTLSDGTYRNALNKPGGYQNLHRVYDREGETCPTCQHPAVRRVVQAQRATFFCPRCQKK